MHKLCQRYTVFKARSEIAAYSDSSIISVAFNVRNLRKGCSMFKIAHLLFPRYQGNEAIVALSAVIAGAIGSIATLVTLAMMILER